MTDGRDRKHKLREGELHSRTQNSSVKVKVEWDALKLNVHALVDFNRSGEGGEAAVDFLLDDLAEAGRFQC
jgi:hypothetical protein